MPSNYRPLNTPTMTREDHTTARKHGVDARNTAKLARRRALGCRVWDHEKGLCGNEAVDAEAPVRMCQRHAGLVLEWLMPKLRAQLEGE